jgi:hypothetical protein
MTDVDLTLPTPIADLLSEAAGSKGETLPDYLVLRGMEAAIMRLSLSPQQMLLREIAYVEAGTYPACGYAWDSGVPATPGGPNLNVACERINSHETEGLIDRQTHAARLPGGSWIGCTTPPE